MKSKSNGMEAKIKTQQLKIKMLRQRVKRNVNEAALAWNSLSRERTRAVTLVMDLFYALRAIDGTPTLKDLVKLAKRIKKD